MGTHVLQAMGLTWRNAGIAILAVAALSCFIMPFRVDGVDNGIKDIKATQAAQNRAYATCTADPRGSQAIACKTALQDLVYGTYQGGPHDTH
jgi:hypothetical protein